MSNYPDIIYGSEGDQFVSYDVQPQIRLGTKMLFDDGREFRFALAGATALIPGTLLQSPVPSNNSGLAVATHAIGDTSLTVTFGGAVTANQYEDGFIWMDSNANGVSTMYKIKSHPAGTAVAVALWVPINEAILAASTVTAIQSPYLSVIISAAAPTAMVVGVAVYAIPGGDYGWIQVHGPCAVINEDTIDAAIGKNVMPSANTAGRVEGMTTNGDDEIVVGQWIEDEVTAQFGGCFLTIE